MLDALRHALRCGWQMEPRAKSHGVSKFAANALAIVACAADADDAIRRRATRHLLHGMLARRAAASRKEKGLCAICSHFSRVGAFDTDGERVDDEAALEESGR